MIMKKDKEGGLISVLTQAKLLSEGPEVKPAERVAQCFLIKPIVEQHWPH